MDLSKLQHIIKIKSEDDLEQTLKDVLGIDISDCAIIKVKMGICKICKQKEDLRYGVCFDCSDKVKGVDIGKGYHLLYEAKNPDNDWIVKQPNFN